MTGDAVLEGDLNSRSRDEKTSRGEAVNRLVLITCSVLGLGAALMLGVSENSPGPSKNSGLDGAVL